LTSNFFRVLFTYILRVLRTGTRSIHRRRTFLIHSA
jgi:hypothetical protein